ncbi:MAG: multidrug efflux SMR transporter [Chloroherpetonaceae bacterium]|nr:multidrug efflux SMR transporter [Chloroherpetonaceae bacterium]MDW8438340.1 multidrug efflux SMR transporter [Chloroherpetonaceae bacterium]
MAWLLLIFAGLCEVGFTTALKLSDGFSNWRYVALFLLFAGASFLSLAKAAQEIPIGTAYAVWTGIGAFGTAIVGIAFFKESADFLRVAFLVLLIGSIIGLKLVSTES